MRKLQDALKRTVDALKSALDQGREKGDELIVRAEKLAEKLKQLGADMGQKLRQTLHQYQGKAKELVTKLRQMFRRSERQTESPLAANRVRRSLADRLRDRLADGPGHRLGDRLRDRLADRIPELDEDEEVRRICETVVRLALPLHKDRVRDRCERHARAIIHRLNRHLHPDSVTEVPSDPEFESELDRAEEPDTEFLSLRLFGNSAMDDVVKRVCAAVTVLLPESRKEQARAMCEQRLTDLIHRFRRRPHSSTTASP